MTGTNRGGVQTPRKAANEPSKVLSDADNQKLFSLIGLKCQTLATAVVQVFLGDPPTLNRWNKRCCGVATLIKDNPSRSYYIRVYDIRGSKLIWEQELYTQFKYRTPRPHFHSFDTDDCPAGLNFTSLEEAQAFRSAVQETLDRRNVRRVEKQRAPAMTPSNSSSSLQAAMPKPNSSMSKSMTNLPLEAKKTKKDKDKKKKKLTKDDIGIPTGFTHLSHIGWDPTKGYDTNNLDPSLKDLFDAAGVSSDQLQDQETANFIYDFIERRGGVDAVKQELARPPPPARGPPVSRGRPPQPPSRGPGVAPPPPSRGPAAPPPPGPHRGNVPPPPPIGAPAPPPPPPVGGPPPPAPPPIAAPTASGGASSAPKPAVPSLTSALQDEIIRGRKLKPVDAKKKEPAVGRNALLNAIQSKDFNLKPAAHTEAQVAEPEEGLAGALAKALATRHKHIRDSDAEEDSSDDDDEFDNEDDWD